MTYNTAPRRSLTKKQRAEFFELHGGVCYLCGNKINAGEDWEVEHVIAREMGGSDDASNTRPAHKTCHKAKSAADKKTIAKSNRIRRNISGLDERGPTKRKPVPQRAKFTWPKRPFQKRMG